MQGAGLTQTVPLEDEDFACLIEALRALPSARMVDPAAARCRARLLDLLEQLLQRRAGET